MDSFLRSQCIPLALIAIAAASGCKSPPPTHSAVIAREPNQLFWGDTHVHAGSTTHGAPTADQNTAYRWAKGLAVTDPQTQASVQLESPLDFLIVTDDAAGSGEEPWVRMVETADRHYAPCFFTTFIGWEWSSELGGKNLHRVVFIKQGQEQARKFAPFSASDGARPDELWAWLEETSNENGVDFIAVPHPPQLTGVGGATAGGGSAPSRKASRMRARWEPVASVTEMIGDFETDPSVSSDDEFADFERSAAVSEEDFARRALLRGLQIAHQTGVNPFEFGMVGSTGAPTGLASTEEHNFVGAPAASKADLSAQGLTAVWAEENTRTSIFDAFERREVYATTGPRIRVRFFGGWNFEEKQANEPNMVDLGYKLGYPMGTRFTKRPGKEGAPSFLMYAVKDPLGANLDRIQIIKGWVDAEGSMQEKIYDVVWSGEREPGPDGKLPPLENTVDLASGAYDEKVGAPALHAFWSDPEFEDDERAFYYVRVLQAPTPRHTTYDALARQEKPSTHDHPATIQERAYSSPIWYTP